MIKALLILLVNLNDQTDVFFLMYTTMVVFHTERSHCALQDK